ncbi:group II intron maturase-specific domain-containing protein [Streptomyces sp. NPDC048290]|uniref:group II intron maturase-specific domain-containing protein n=1 Tax=Streptomyces sp. NPDC048290 TaxID=3155811 RepID=UPI003429AE34
MSSTKSPGTGLRKPKSESSQAPSTQCTSSASTFRKDTGDDVEALREDIADLLPPLGPRLSEAKSQVVHMSEACDFLRFRTQWRRKRGTDQWHVHTFITDRSIRQLNDKIRALTDRTSQQSPRDVLIRLNQMMRGWADSLKHAVCKAALSCLASHDALHRQGHIRNDPVHFRQVGLVVRCDDEREPGS